MNVVDSKQQDLFVHAMRDLNYDPSDFRVEVVALPGPTGDGRVFARLPRKRVTLLRLSNGRIHELDAYLDDGWAGELLQAVLSGRLTRRD